LIAHYGSSEIAPEITPTVLWPVGRLKATIELEAFAHKLSSLVPQKSSGSPRMDAGSSGLTAGEKQSRLFKEGRNSGVVATSDGVMR
jgi:hypothetical protein